MIEVSDGIGKRDAWTWKHRYVLVILICGVAWLMAAPAHAEVYLHQSGSIFEPGRRFVKIDDPDRSNPNWAGFAWRPQHEEWLKEAIEKDLVRRFPDSDAAKAAYSNGFTWTPRPRGSNRVQDTPPRVKPPPAPTPKVGFTCRKEGAVRYTKPGTTECFDFEAAGDGAQFEYDGRVYTWVRGTSFASLDDYVRENKRLGMFQQARTSAGTPTPAPVAQSPAPTGRSSASPGMGNDNSGYSCDHCITYAGKTKTNDSWCAPVWSNTCAFPVDVTISLSVQHRMKTIQGYSGVIAAKAARVQGTSNPCAWFVEEKPVVKRAVVPASYKGVITGCRKL